MSQNPSIAALTPLDDRVLAQIGGEIDHSRSASLRGELAALMDAEPGRLVLDLTAVPYMDSSGVAALIEAMKRHKRAGRKLVLCGLQPKVCGIFQIARLDTVFTIADSAANAARA